MKLIIFQALQEDLDMQLALKLQEGEWEEPKPQKPVWIPPPYTPAPYKPDRKVRVTHYLVAT